MSKLRNRMNKIASDQNSEAYKGFVRDLANMSDDFEEILKGAFANEDTYNVIMTNDEVYEVVGKLKELNQTIGMLLLRL